MGQEQSRNGPAAAEISRHRRLSGFWRVVLVASSALSVLIAIYTLFTLGIYFGYTPLTNQYHYGLVALLLPLAFILWPAWGTAPRDRIPLYDVALYGLAFAAGVYFMLNSDPIIDEGWEYAAPEEAVWVGYLLWALVLEATRRAGGTALFAIVLVVSFYPLYAEQLPEVLAGTEKSLEATAMWHAMSEESILGIPMRAFANLVFGFLIFGVALQHTGGGKFFLNLAFALLGHVRGGPAKVAIFASGLMGSMSGSVITNVMTTGVLTIPAMKRVGFGRSYAGGVEACASTGGVLMPPIMGATAFVMATFLEVAYVEIAIAAVIPSILYFFGLFMQIDAYAARNDLAGLPRAEMPSLRQTLKEGWYFIAVFILLVWMLVYLRQESWAPFYATALLLAVNQIFPYHRWSRGDLVEFIAGTGRLFAELAAILAGIGLIVGALITTGKVGTMANDLLRVAGGDIFVLLLMGAMTSFILGIGMTVTAAYIFLAIALAPALIQGGLDPMAVHLFILYWGMLSYITPPVALGAYAAATIAEADPMRTGFQAMRLGSIIYFIPFFFVLDPAFILQGEWSRTLLVTASALFGIVLVAGALQGYLVLLGDLTRHALLQWPIRAMVLLAGLLIATPGGGLIPWSDLELALAAGALMAGAVGLFAVARGSRIRPST
ncbi:MAG: TRAP transporter permease [candidate division NC10 bacterium]|nr:TRAP transporter permease [candidate division NC10 bacterium]